LVNISHSTIICLNKSTLYVALVNISHSTIISKCMIDTVYFYLNKLLITQNPSSYSYTSMYLICWYI
jgi:hypothetical protein